MTYGTTNDSLVTIFFLACSKELPDSHEGLKCDDIHINKSHRLSDEIAVILKEYTQKGLPSVTALIHTPDEGTIIRSSGFASLESRKLATHCNSYLSGSVAKMYTVVATLVLYEKGMIALDDAISEYLPKSIVDNLPNGNTATIRHLMNHKAGMPDHDDDEKLNDYIEDNDGNLPDAVSQLTYLYDNDPRFEAGSNADYSSTHSVVLALIIDEVTGRHHSHIISEYIIQKAGLTDTYYKNEAGYPKPDNMITPYIGTQDLKQNITNEASNYALGSHGDAGIFTTANDYFKFIRSLFNFEILQQSSVELMVGEDWLVDDDNGAFGFGLGVFMIGQNSNLTKVGHSGATLGAISHVYTRKWIATL